jgi:hypothetical protein
MLIALTEIRAVFDRQCHQIGNEIRIFDEDYFSPLHVLFGELRPPPSCTERTKEMLLAEVSPMQPHLVNLVIVTEMEIMPALRQPVGLV